MASPIIQLLSLYVLVAMLYCNFMSITSTLIDPITCDSDDNCNPRQHCVQKETFGFPECLCRPEFIPDPKNYTRCRDKCSEDRECDNAGACKQGMCFDFCEQDYCLQSIIQCLLLEKLFHCPQSATSDRFDHV